MLVLNSLFPFPLQKLSKQKQNCYHKTKAPNNPSHFNFSASVPFILIDLHLDLYFTPFPKHTATIALSMPFSTQMKLCLNAKVHRGAFYAKPTANTTSSLMAPLQSSRHDVLCSVILKSVLVNVEWCNHGTGVRLSRDEDR